MHLTKLAITNVRSITNFTLELKAEEAPGWHVILGDNGAGKSSVIRSLALIFSGGPSVSATRQDWQAWLRAGESRGSVEATIHRDPELDAYIKTGKQSASMTVRAELERIGDTIVQNAVGLTFAGSTSTASRSFWSNAVGWFSASFGPFRRFTGGDREWDRLFVAPEYRRAASHLSAFGEDVALTEALRWLQQLHVLSLEASDDHTSRIRDAVRQFINRSGLLPHGAEIADISSQRVTLRDGEGNDVPVEQMSDGYRSVLSLTFELIRQMFAVYGPDIALDHIDTEQAVIRLPGVVAIDEIDAHLHPAWQARIGDWFLERFPQVQFVVSTHSPIVCRAARRGSIWRLPTPGTDETAGRVTGLDLERLVSGNILEALNTEYFGEGIERAPEAAEKLDRIALLNKRKAVAELGGVEKLELEELQRQLPTVAASIAG
jgi:predicted ATPase